MSNSNRRKDLTIGLGLGSVAAIFFGAYIWGQTNYLEERAQEQAANHSHYYEEIANEKIATECLIAAGAERSVCTQEVQQAYQDKKRAQQDLEAQRAAHLSIS